MSDQGKWSQTNIKTEVKYMVPLIRDACCTALYARLRPIHLSLIDHTNCSLYTKDLELPVPFADAIQNFGPFNPTSIPQNYKCVHVYPENILHEGRLDENWRASTYEEIIPTLKELGIPLKSVDTSAEFGTAWWCFRARKVFKRHELVCLYPLINYSDHSAFLASLFLTENQDGTESLSLTCGHDDDNEWLVRFRDLLIEFKLRAFSALCHDPPEIWNEFYTGSS